MYRAPEMLDLYQNFPINQQSDIWVGNKSGQRSYRPKPQINATYVNAVVSIQLKTTTKTSVLLLCYVTHVCRLV